MFIIFAIHFHLIMARPRKKTKVQAPPRVKGFIPMGYYANQSEPLQLEIEEYEAMRLLDYDDLSQEQASRIMEISRPTLTRIYDRARKKIATAFNESRQILIEGGKAIYNTSWYECANCLSHFNSLEKWLPDACPLCNSTHVITIREELK